MSRRQLMQLLVVVALVLSATVAGASPPEDPPGQSAPVNSSPPSISGTAIEDQTLTSGEGSWNDGPQKQFTFQWNRCDSKGATCSAVPGATSARYLLAAVDVGKTLRVTVVATNKNGSTAATSDATTVVVPVLVETTPTETTPTETTPTETTPTETTPTETTPEETTPEETTPEPEPEPELVVNLIQNGDFATGTGGWGKQGNATLSQSMVEFHGGLASMKVDTAGGVKDQGASGRVGLEAGRSYTVTFMAKAPLNSGLRVYVRDVSVLSNVAMVNFTGNGSWQQVSARFNTTNTANHDVRITTASSQSAFSFYVDDVVVSGDAGGTISEPPSLEPEETISEPSSPEPAPATQDVFFVGDFEDGNFLKYERRHDLTNESLVVVAENPSGYQRVGKMITSAKSTWPGGSTSVSGQASFIGRNPPKPYELNGKTAWYRGAFLLPSGNDPRYPGRYRYPSAMQAGGKGRGWTVLWQQHEFQNGKWSNTLFITPGGYLTARSVGGVTASHGTEDFDFFERTVAGPLPFDTWIHFVVGATWTWEKGKGGLMEVFINGQKKFPTADMPSSWRTQWYRSDGETKGYQYMQYGQYRADPVSYVGLPSDYEDTVYITPQIIGPTRTSVGG